MGKAGTVYLHTSLDLSLILAIHVLIENHKLSTPTGCLEEQRKVAENFKS